MLYVFGFFDPWLCGENKTDTSYSLTDETVKESFVASDSWLKIVSNDDMQKNLTEIWKILFHCRISLLED